MRFAQKALRPPLLATLMVIENIRIAATIILSLTGSKAFACSCGEFPTISEQYKSAEIVVLAKLKAIGSTTFKWKVTESIKGAKPKFLDVEQGLTSCDPQIKDGQEWLLFLKENESPVLGWCSFNRNTEFLEKGWRQ
ncbi:hypothetical protein [Microbulbifer rhizosphaerae]|uniref:Tissue inhibitor of metalloproteinase n=1 Tax=Microbulbifer rhizosphaerae TaxID=1562603 RepID=A0A7W4Z8J4_9GAMM|nr:hypothetical protein [Microbulbifer rhizosphaerae]MBB3060611.1 hypothetical protein [Microbulbifer rhizosphaerae]